MAVKALERKHHDLYEPLCAIVGSKYVADEDFAVYAYSLDYYGWENKIPAIVVRPGNTEEVSNIVKLANETHTPVIPVGGKASELPPSMPRRNILVDLTRLDKIIEIDEENNLVTAECGIGTDELQYEVERRVPGRTVSTIWVPFHGNTLGGSLAGGCVFGGAGEFFSNLGWTGDWVQALQVVLPNGEIVQTGLPGVQSTAKPYLRENLGPPLTTLFMNDGGMFGIKTRATMRMLRRPKIRKTISFAFDTMEDWYKASSKLSKIAPFPYIINAMTNPELLAGLGMEPVWANAIGVGGESEEEVEAKIKEITKVNEEHGAKPATPGTGFFASVCAGGIRERLISNMGSFWSALGIPLFNEWWSPRSEFLEGMKGNFAIYEKHKKEFEKHKIAAVVLVSPILDTSYWVGLDFIYDPSDQEAKGFIRKVAPEFWEYNLSRGSSMVCPMAFTTVGKQSIRYMTPQYYNLLKTLKRAIDPNNIMISLLPLSVELEE